MSVKHFKDKSTYLAEQKQGHYYLGDKEIN